MYSDILHLGFVIAAPPRLFLGEISSIYKVARARVRRTFVGGPCDLDRKRLSSFGSYKRRVSFESLRFHVFQLFAQLSMRSFV